MLILAAVMLLAVLSGCAGKENAVSVGPVEGQSDLAYIQEKGTLVVGVTEYAPMDYRQDDRWTGFDAELAAGFAQMLGVQVEFVEINWDDKVRLLENGRIDCIWNGMALTEQLQRTISCTEPYLSNGQVAVFRARDIGRYTTVESCSHVLFAVEAGSTGVSVLKDLRYRYTTFDTQLAALQSVSARKTDAAVVDLVMADYYIREVQPDLAFSLMLKDEHFCAGFRKDSDLTGLANEYLSAVYADGTIQTLAEKYGIEGALLYSET